MNQSNNATFPFKGRNAGANGHQEIFGNQRVVVDIARSGDRPERMLEFTDGERSFGIRNPGENSFCEARILGVLLFDPLEDFIVCFIDFFG
jgi:hypothetical protein